MSPPSRNVRVINPEFAIGIGAIKERFSYTVSQRHCDQWTHWRFACDRGWGVDCRRTTRPELHLPLEQVPFFQVT